MTDPQPGTAVAKLPKKSLTEMMIGSGDHDARILAYQAASQIQKAKILQEAAIELANTQWGKVSPVAAAAVAKWALEAGIDPVRHIFLLGGKIYDAAELYIDKLASLPEFKYGEYTIIAPLDTRKFSGLGLTPAQEKSLVEEQQALNVERLKLQMEWGVPSNINQFPDTAAAVMTELYFKDGTSVTGVNWAGSRGRKKGQQGGSYDPVGDSEPVKTAITRSLRKAAKQKVPVWFKKGELGERFEHAQELIEQGREAARIEPARPTSAAIPGTDLQVDTGTGSQAVDQESGYGEDPPAPTAQVEGAGVSAPPRGVEGVETGTPRPSPAPVDQGDAYELKAGEIEIVCPNCGQLEIVDEKFVPPTGVTSYDCSAGCPAKMLTRKALEERKPQPQRRTR